MKKPITVLTYGSFDLFHIGHLRILQKAAGVGDRLIVGISSDEFHAKKKGEEPIMDFWARTAIIRELKCVDFVLPESTWEQKTRDIELNGVDLLIMGDDWRGKFDDLPCKVLYLPRTKGISTSDIKKVIKDAYSTKKSQVPRDSKV